MKVSSPYDVLGVAASADFEVIDAAYIALKAKVQAAAVSGEDTRARLYELEAAYLSLSDPSRRAAIDWPRAADTTAAASPAGPAWLVPLGVTAALALIAVVVLIYLDRRSPAPAVRAADIVAEAAVSAPRGLVKQMGEFIAWSEETDGAVTTYEVGEYLVTMSAEAGEDGSLPKLRVEAPGRPAFEMVGNAGFEKAGASFAVAQLDRATPEPELLYTDFSGGAHCCSSVVVIEPVAGGWRKVDMGAWDGEFDALPQDLNGDGRADFVMVDESFLYTFAPYAGSEAPPRVLNAIDGRMVDVSAQPAYRHLYREYMGNTQAGCAEGDNSACAAYVAAAARVGRSDEAWALMLASHARDDDWELPRACRIEGDSCPDAHVVTFATFPEALQWFLGEAGYLPRTYISSAADVPSFSCARRLSAVETLVCGDAALRAADRALAEAYTRRLALSRERAAVRASQHSFLAARDRLLDRDAVEQHYNFRLLELQ